MPPRKVETDPCTCHAALSGPNHPGAPGGWEMARLAAVDPSAAPEMMTRTVVATGANRRRLSSPARGEAS